MRDWRRLGRSLVALAAVLAACGGTGEGLDENGRPLGESDGIGPFEPTIESIQDHVFTPICAECHVGAGAPQGLVLSDAQTSYDNLVGVPSSEVPAYYRVLAGDPDASYLVHKVEARLRRRAAVRHAIADGLRALDLVHQVAVAGIARLHQHQ